MQAHSVRTPKFNRVAATPSHHIFDLPLQFDSETRREEPDEQVRATRVRVSGRGLDNGKKPPKGDKKGVILPLIGDGGHDAEKRGAGGRGWSDACGEDHGGDNRDALLRRRRHFRYSHLREAVPVEKERCRTTSFYV
ncbi:hypothetical protein QQ045_008082 [Rhodiola kirilowii]